MGEHHRSNGNDPLRLPPDIAALTAQAINLDTHMQLAKAREQGEQQNHRRCVCGKRIREKGIQAFGFYVGEIPRQIAGMDIPLGNIQVTTSFCSKTCEHYKKALENGLEWPGQELLGTIPVAGYQQLPAMFWYETADR